MRNTGYISILLISAVLFAGCHSSWSLKKQKGQHEQKDIGLIHSLLEAPAVDELTASLSFGINGSKVNGQLRMRRGHSIQVSASMLGLVEVARIEFLPEMVVVMDRVHDIYSVCHYADVPYRNELGLDFEVIQALLWNRLFSPGSNGDADAAARLQVMGIDNNNVVSIKDMECGYIFQTDGVNRLGSVSKTGKEYGFRIGYSDFSYVSGEWIYPLGLSIDLMLSKTNLDVTIKMSSVSVEKKTWPDRTQVTRRMRQVSLDELLDIIDL